MRLRQPLARQMKPVCVPGEQMQGKAHEGVARHPVEEGQLACPPHERLGIGRVGMGHGLDCVQGLLHRPDERRLVDDFRRGLAQDVGADDPPAAIAEKLGHPRPRPVDQRAAHGPVGEAIDAEIAPVLCPRLTFRETHPGQCRLREDDVDVVSVIDAALDGQGGIGCRHDPLGLGGGGQLVGPRDVAAGIDVGGGGFEFIVDDDAPGIVLDARISRGTAPPGRAFSPRRRAPAPRGSPPGPRPAARS